MSKTTKHTPEPWAASDRNDYGDFDGNSRVIIADDMRIAVVHDNGDPALGGDANTRLMVAAPKLLTACELALAAMEQDYTGQFATVTQVLIDAISAAGVNP